MWHRRRRHRLSLETEHRLSLLRNLAKELIEHQRVVTTHIRAKEAARFVEKLVTAAKKNTLHARRELVATLGSGTESVVKRLMDVVAPKFSDRKGGYTRILRYRFRRGDGAQLSLLEFSTPIEEAKKKKEKKPKPEKEKDAKKEISDPEKKVHKEKEEQPKKEEKKDPAEAKEIQAKETPKKGGFLRNLRQFLTGKDEQ